MEVLTSRGKGLPGLHGQDNPFQLSVPLSLGALRNFLDPRLSALGETPQIHGSSPSVPWAVPPTQTPENNKPAVRSGLE